MRLSMRDTWGEALATYRHHPGRVLGVALVLLVPAELLGGLARWAEEQSDRRFWTVALVAVLALLHTVVTSLGSAFYAGMVDLTVQADREGAAQPGIGQVVRRVPHWRVIGVSLLAGVICAAGFVILVVPGLVLTTLLAIAAPVLVLEDLGVRAALRRSARLVRPHFWAVALVVTLPMLLESSVIDVVASVVGHSALGEILVDGVLSTALIALVMLLEVHAAHWLVEHDPAPPARLVG